MIQQGETSGKFLSCVSKKNYLVMFLSTQNIQYKYAQKISALRNFGKKESGYPCFQSSLLAETPAFLRHVFV